MPIPPLLLGHRGARGQKSIPENTLAAFDLALAGGCDGFEFDVRLSADGQAVIGHDAHAGGREIAQTPAQELALPLLGDVLKRYQNTAFLDIEVKVAGLEDISLNLLRAHPPARGYVLSSFLPEVLEEVHGRDATIPLGLICEKPAQYALCSRLPVQYVILHYTLVRQSVIAEIKSNNRKVYVWTVNSTADIKRFAEWGVDGIISDDPGKLVLALRRKASQQK